MNKLDNYEVENQMSIYDFLGNELPPIPEDFMNPPVKQFEEDEND